METPSSPETDLTARIQQIRAEIDAIAPRLTFVRDEVLADLVDQLDTLVNAEEATPEQTLALQQLTQKRIILRHELSNREARHSS